MPLKYKTNILELLKKNGYSTYKLIQNKYFSAGSVQKLRTGEVLGADGIATLCELLQCQPGDILRYEPKKE
ncbi:helix-turn-helix transcriptional regulator [Ruminococcus sp.]|uniref:helix-turn-helix domain-containing protein n=1 Tax=Ruminococcus sp. TaxID=41978 RepID=UPI0025EA1F82|nr:helix-turn-helix transcriptional regulator [Ruminococcus sp.]MBQ8966762.1 helix-turn-helix transcriptional regulator [Ruminococcus sp.]